MDWFTNRKSVTESSIIFSVVVDKKGRISIPADIRKTLGINTYDKLDLILSVSEGKIIFKKGGRNGP